MVFFAADAISRRPGEVGGTLGVSDENRNAQTLDLSQQLSGTKSIQVRLEAAPIESPQNLETALLLSPQFENVAEKTDS
jgi:hypothetical protein